MQIKKLILFFPLLIFIGCKKEYIKKNYPHEIKDRDLLSNYFSKLHIAPLDTINLTNNHHIFKQISNNKVAGMTHVRDSVWSNGYSMSSFYESDQMVVTPANSSYIYPGSILKAASITSDQFETFSGYQTAPIHVQLSFPSSLSIGNHSFPSLSNSRVFLRKALMSPDFDGNHILKYSDYFSAFSKYEEVKYAFGYNVNQQKIFSSTNSSFDNNYNSTHYSNKFMASYTVENFTYNMKDPTIGELIDINSIPQSVFDGISPVYINSVTYGRFGLLVLESNNNSYLIKSAFEKMIKKILKKTTESYTQQETNLFSNCRITIYLLGSTIGSSTTQLLINPNPDGVSDFITQNIGTFTSTDPGVPIYYTAKYLKDNSKFKTVFKINR